MDLTVLFNSGYAIAPNAASDWIMTQLADALDTPNIQAGGIRNLFDAQPLCRGLLQDPALSALVRGCFENEPFVVKATLFDKRPGANWSVRWHQDQTIAVRQRHDSPGFGPWSEKAGIPHVEPPAHVLERMLAVRIHIDPCGQDAGPLVVSPGTHNFGRLTPDQAKEKRAAQGQFTCTCDTGDVLLMRPLLLHTSSKAQPSVRRRVIHLEVTDAELPGQLDWAYRDHFMLP